MVILITINLRISYLAYVYFVLNVSYSKKILQTCHFSLPTAIWTSGWPCETASRWHPNSAIITGKDPNSREVKMHCHQAGHRTLFQFTTGPISQHGVSSKACACRGCSLSLEWDLEFPGGASDNHRPRRTTAGLRISSLTFSGWHMPVHYSKR